MTARRKDPLLPARAPTVVIYGKPDCHLCDEALAVLHRVRETMPFVLLERDISFDEAWTRAYFERIPVVVVDGEELFDFHVDEAVLRERLARANAGAVPRVESGR